MKFCLPIDPSTIPTAQHKGVRVVHGVPMFYKTKALTDFEKRLEGALAPFYPKFRADDGNPVSLYIAYLFPYPKSTPKRDRVDMAYMTQRPDGDNISKAVIDALGDKWAKDRRSGRFFVARRGFFADDAAIANLGISKFRTTGEPGIVITIEEWKPYPNPSQTPTKPL